jgi:hypothetical protein
MLRLFRHAGNEARLPPLRFAPDPPLSCSIGPFFFSHPPIPPTYLWGIDLIFL